MASELRSSRPKLALPGHSQIRATTSLLTVQFVGNLAHSSEAGAGGHTPPASSRSPVQATSLDLPLGRARLWHTLLAVQPCLCQHVFGDSSLGG